LSETLGEGMSFADAEAALRSDEQDSSAGQLTTEQAPSATPEGLTDPQVQPETPAPTPEPETPNLFEGEPVNPDDLVAAHPELAPLVKQLQGAFTRKTQDLAAKAKQFEEFGDPDQVAAALELHTNLRNPEYLQAFHRELGGVLQEMGLSPAEAAEVAREITTEQAAGPTAPQLSPELQALVNSDPELRPFAERHAALEQRMAEFEASQAQREQALEQQRFEMAMAGEIQRQDQEIRSAHPEYSEEDFNAIYERASFYDGNLLQAADQFEADKARIISAWVAQKAAVPTAAQPSPGAGTVSEPEHEGPRTLDDAQRQAEAWLQANEAQDLVL